MKSQLIIIAAICLTYVAYALPVPDEEVSVAHAAPASEVQLGIAKKTEEKPIELVNSAKTIETRAVEASKAIAKQTSHPSDIDFSSAKVNEATKSGIVQDVKKTGPKADKKLDAPDAKTAISEKKANVEEKDIITPAASATDTERNDATSVAVPELKKGQSTLDENENEKEEAAHTETEEPIEAPRTLPLVDAPAANTEVQKQVVDESKPVVRSEPTASVGKSTELPKESIATTTNEVEEKKSEDAKVTTQIAAAKKLAAGEEIKESISGERVIELKSIKNEKEKAASISPLMTVVLADPAAADISPVIVPSALEAKKLIAEEDQPTNQERINGHEKDTSTSASSVSNVATDVSTANQAKSEGTVQVIPSTKNANEGQVKPAEANEQTGAEFIQGSAPGGNKQIKSNAEENQSKNKNVSSIIEKTFAPEPKKIEGDAASAKAVQENKVGNDTKKTITETEQQLLKKTDDKKISFEEKSSSEKKSEESNDSSESKESDESVNSKENKSN